MKPGNLSEVSSLHLNYHFGAELHSALTPNYCHVKGHHQGYWVTRKRKGLLHPEAFYRKLFCSNPD